VQQWSVRPQRRPEEISGNLNRLWAMNSEIYDEASEVDAEDGAVVVKGPDAFGSRPPRPKKLRSGSWKAP
jgi:hypothetical protein